MPTDPSIISSLQAPQIENPIDVQNKAMTMRALAMQNQSKQQAYDDDQAQRAAFRQNTTVGPDGRLQINHTGMISQLAQTNPQMAMQAQQELSQQDQAMIQARHQKAFDIAKSIPSDPSVPLDQKNAAWKPARAEAIAAGLPGAEQSPEEYPGDDFVNQMKQHTMQQLLTADQMLKGQETDAKIADIKENRAARLQGAQDAAAARNDSKQQNYTHQVQQILESARGAPEVQQAQKDLYAAKKFESLTNLYGDPNKLNPQQVMLAAQEVGKMASGGAPTLDELKGLNPNNLPKELASLAQAFTAKPTAANQGAFINALGDYVGALKKDALGVVQDKYGRVLETNKDVMGAKNYQNYKAQYLDPIVKQVQMSGRKIQMLDPQGNVRSVPEDQVDAALKAGGQRL